jgi:signal transduction histidine kinase
VVAGPNDGPDVHHDELLERMQQLQRVEGLETFAAGIAHDFNNSLAVIFGGLGLVEKALQHNPALAEVLRDMRVAATRSSQLAMQLMQLGRSSEKAEYGTVELSHLVHRTTGLMRRRAPSTITIDVSVADELLLRGQEVDLHFALMNLIVNARDAMPGGGTIMVSARKVSLDSAQTAAKQLTDAGDYVELAVKDNGSGMDAAIRARAFEPFFTTKPPGHGTGLGLAMVKDIVGRHHGAVEIESAVGAGSTFTIWLPALT